MDRPYIIADQHGRIRYMHPGKLRSIRYASIMLAYYDIPCQGYAEEMAEFLSKYWEVGTEIISRIVPVKEKKDLKKLRKMRERREGVVQLINMVDPPVPCGNMECRLCVEEYRDSCRSKNILRLSELESHSGKVCFTEMGECSLI